MIKQALAIGVATLGLVAGTAPIAEAGKPTGPTVAVSCTYQDLGSGSYQYNVFVSTSGGVADVTVGGLNSTGGTTNLALTKTQGKWTASNTDTWYFTNIQTVYTLWHKAYAAAWTGTQACTAV